MMNDPLTLLLIFAALALGGISKGITGIGLPLLAVPLLSIYLGVEHAVVLMVLPSLFSNGWLVFVHRRQAPPARLLTPFLLAGIIGGALGTWLLAIMDDRSLTRILALWLGLYLLQLVLKPSFRMPQTPFLGPIFGLLSGAVQGATGISAPLIAPYLTGLGLTAQSFVFSIALSFTLFSASQITALFVADLWTIDRLVQGLYALVPVMIFVQIGVWLGRRFNAETFRIALLIIFILMEIELIYSGFISQS
ncbi:hypothetical protein JCM17846_17580 [Iodidimonas nitroreducens]|uniref:Probable membrane transporter protein n=2 Tax=Iodidimonas nitroreducens TaxID=1236968 RepID=A0A5A7NAU2_9PROT|nr:hypothetical protein JCM17846_17580 [Iodidimonas nitroreducens]